MEYEIIYKKSQELVAKVVWLHHMKNTVNF
jgi:hypothetical protein